MDQQLAGRRFELSLGSAGYPALLAEVERPPKCLYGIGDPAALQPGVAIIGARKATPYGISCARYFASHVADRGITIVSGGARGCDQEAHRAAVEAGVSTVVVFGSAADVPYPKSGLKLFQRVIDQGGAIVSEHPWGSPPLRPYFVQRNRIIAGLSVLLIVVEAGLPSGTFSTATAAIEQGKHVAVVPGAITSPNARGSNRLIHDFAVPLIDYEALDEAIDLAFEDRGMLALGVEDPENADPSQSFADDPLLEALAAAPYSAPELTAYFGFSTSELAQRLSQYELQGLVQRGRDGRYQVCARVRK